MAMAGGGKILNIDHSQKIPYVESPYDTQIITATESMNTTYLPYGEFGRSEYRRMRNLDGQIRNSGNGSYMDWGSYRGGGHTSNNLAQWDLVEAIKDPQFDLASISNQDLPEEMRALSLIDKEYFILEQFKVRENLKLKVAMLQKKREQFVSEYRAQHNQERGDSFAEAFKKIIIEQLKEKGFEV
jgi:hypothetical protein